MKRRYYVDFMKFIGICCLFFAHVQGPEYLEEIRGFDVPMLVILSGVLTSTSVKKIIIHRNIYTGELKD